ncbi:DUF2938 domain-containing protein [Rhodobacteraceae bacterium XHP0102]|nr:DUF2938 domain-containing protein [Rhodobacteraceae bacterium XHP0102]
MSVIGIGVLMGLGGTLAMDIWAVILTRMAGVPAPNWGNVGRWVAHLGRGTVFHSDISKSAAVTQERLIGWLFHYAVGAIYGALFLGIMGQSWLEDTPFLPLWIFSILTIGAGWFLLHPGLGLGWALSKTATPWKARGLGLLAHTMFAFGMWGSALAF